ncbi:MAG: polysaccharide biosynthesis tyrosine autokinase [Anaerolineae bacterium]
MELKLLIILLRRWAWLLIIGLILGSGTAYFAASSQTPIYQASTKLMVIQSRESTLSQFSTQSDYELVQTYMELLATQPVLQTTSDQLGFPVSAGQVSSRQIEGSRLLVVTVRDTDPQQAALIANTIVEALIEQNDKLQASRFSASEQSLQAQIKQVESQIESLRNTQGPIEVTDTSAQLQALETQIFDLQHQIADLQIELDNASVTPVTEEGPAPLSPEQQRIISDKQGQIDLLQLSLDATKQAYSALLFPDQQRANPNGDQGNEANLALYQQIYTNLLSNYESVRLARVQSTPNVAQVEQATVPTYPISPQPMKNLFLGGVVGLIIMGAIAFLIEYLDDTLKTPADVTHVLGLPVIGYLAEIGEMVVKSRNSKTKSASPYVTQHPRSPLAEAFRSLRTNLEFANVDEPLRSILVTSPGPGEGKTTVATNLAIVMAQAGKEVALVDCDLRRPRIHRILNLSNRIGLSDYFRGQEKLPQIMRPVGEEALKAITSGSLPPNPTELLQSQKMVRLLADLKEVSDIAVIDSPPFLVTDAAVIASRVDGVIMIVQPGHTHAEAAMAMLEQLNRAGARVIGVVLNRIPQRRPYYYGGYRYYYSPYYNGYSYEYLHDDSKKNGRTNWIGRLRHKARQVVLPETPEAGD